ncbi:MAG TPA: KUP/HAK/KT family potassium transporter, partial [Sphingomonas sp.]|uniref:KUP/HAK/KT family potassium transporter n=1 Tax=Sphingomonas sp. TaxID=28214 RepID=UPI002EDB6599
CMLGVLSATVWKWRPWTIAVVTGVFLLIDGAYLASNMTKIPDGGWFPLLIGAIAFTVLTTWATGRRLLRVRLDESTMPVDVFIRSAAGSVGRVPGTAVFLSASPKGVPSALLHNMKHNRVLHERVVILTVAIEGVPLVEDRRCGSVEDLGHGFWRVILHYGFMQEIDVPGALATVAVGGGPFRPMDTSYFLGRQTLISSSRPGMARWREQFFAWMLRNAETAMEFFKLPSNRVVELGSQVEI